MHSASWDESIELNGKTIAIIGTGSSAIQIVPQIQRAAKHIIAFMRSVTWISPPIASGVLEKTKADSSDKTQEGSLNAQYYYTDEDKQRFRDHPDELLRYRKELECQFNGMFDIFIAGSETSKLAENAMREEMYRRIGPGHKELKERLIPRWPPGCRRLTPGDGYLEALVKDNVTTVHREIVNIVPAGLVDDAAKLHEVDIIVCATGFDVSHKPSFKVLGVNSANMHDEFDPEPQVYLGMTVPKFPNYFTSNSVRGNWASGTALHAHEVCIDYILKCIQRMQDEDIRALEVKKEPIEDLYEHIDEWHKGSVWNADCKRFKIVPLA